MAAPALQTSDKAQARRPIVGSGRYTYEVIHHWGELPDSHKWGNTHGVIYDSAERIYIIHDVNASSSCPNGVVVFDHDGKFITSWGPEFKGGGHGLEIRKEGGEEFLYCCDVGRKVFEKRTLKGEVVWSKGTPAEAGVYNDKVLFNPTNIAFAPDGGFYVADGYGSSFIHQYDKDAKWVRCWGGRGAEPGQLSCPHGLFVDSRGPTPLLLVADRSNVRLQYFTLEGKHVSFVNHDLRHPCHFDFHGDVVVIPDLHSRVTLLDKQNRLICQLGDGEILQGLRDKTPDQFPPGRFITPHGCRFLPTGDIFITEWVTTGRVNLLRRVS